MPQMAPMNWLIMFLIFSLTFIIFFLLNFYFNINKPNLIKTSFKTKTINWQW